MAGKRGKRPPRPKIVLNPGIADDCDDDPPCMGAPDDDGWVYLKRAAKPKEGKRGEEKRRRRKT